MGDYEGLIATAQELAQRYERAGVFSGTDRFEMISALRNAAQALTEQTAALREVVEAAKKVATTPIYRQGATVSLDLMHELTIALARLDKREEGDG